MASPRVIASFLALSAAAILIASCSEQPLPTGASAINAPATLRTAPTEFVDMLADPTEPTVTAFDATPPIVYPPGSGPDPWPPGPPPRAQPGVPVPTDPTVSPRMHMVINPEPVTYSGVPVPLAGCRSNPHTWYYDQVLISDSGIGINFTERENYFDGRYTGTVRETISLRGNGTVTLHSRWCSGYPKPHYAQTIFKGRDDNGEPVTFSGPWVRMLTP